MKPIILTFTSFYLPGYRGGGPIRSIANMVERLSGEFDFYIITSDRDLGDGQAYPNVQTNEWNNVGNAKVFYASKAMQSSMNLVRLMRETDHDLLYLNSFFNPHFTIRPLLARKLGFAPKRAFVIAPRGEFSSGALKIKPWKKALYLQLARTFGICSNAYWHASTYFESIDIQCALSATPERILVAGNIASSPDPSRQEHGTLNMAKAPEPLSCKSLRICFLSRVAPMKNLTFALEILSQLNLPNLLVEFNIFGPQEDTQYWEQCQALIRNLPSNVKAVYCGCIENSRVTGVIGNHDIFFVPTLGENFGHVFIEALSAGVPILVSDRTPWRDLESRGIGWDIPLNQPKMFLKAIESAALFSSELRSQMKVNCINFAQQQVSNPSGLETYRTLFSRAMTSSNPRNTTQH